MAMNRFGALRTIATAVRTAARPGSPGIGERLMSLPRLFAATFRGEYAGTTRGRLLLVLGAVAYVVSPSTSSPSWRCRCSASPTTRWSCRGSRRRS